MFSHRETSEQRRRTTSERVLPGGSEATREEGDDDDAGRALNIDFGDGQTVIVALSTATTVCFAVRGVRNIYGRARERVRTTRVREGEEEDPL